MIKRYYKYEDFLKEQEKYLDESPLETAFIKTDSKLFNVENGDVLLSVFDGKSPELLLIKVKPFNTMLYGNINHINELVHYIIDNDIEIDNILARDDLAISFLKIYDDIKGYEHYMSLSMNILKTTFKTEPSSNLVCKATSEDITDLYNMTCDFINECNLNENVSLERITSKLDNYYVYKENNEILSFALKASNGKISSVYTKNKARGKGYARLVVNYLKNILIDEFGYSCLYVEKNNPISNKLYASLGYKFVISQSEFRKK